MRTRTKRTGAKAVVALALMAALPPGWAAAPSGGQRDHAHALISGSVFREDGLSLPGAEIELEAIGGSVQSRKFKKMRAVSDARGEFAFRVPPVPAEYRLRATAPGCQPEQRQVRVSTEERIDVFFRLRPASKKSESAPGGVRQR